MNLKDIFKRHTDRVCDMANLREKTTGINTIIFVSSREHRHKPRLKVLRSLKESFSVSIEDNPRVILGDPSIVSTKVLEQVKEWIILNKDLLLEYWNDPLFDTERLYTETKKVK